MAAKKPVKDDRQPYNDNDRPGKRYGYGYPGGLDVFVGPADRDNFLRQRGLFAEDDAFTAAPQSLIGGGLNLSRIRRSSIQSPLFASYVRLMRTGVVGNRAITPTFSHVEDDDLRNTLRMEFEEWGYDAGVGAELSLWEIQCALIEAMLVDGRSFAVIQQSPNFSHGFRLLPLPREMMAEYYHDANNRIWNGQEYDADMKLIAYHFRKFDDLAYQRASTAGELMQGVLGTFPARNKDAIVRVPVEQVIDLHAPSMVARNYNFPSWAVSFAEGIRKMLALDDAYLRLYQSGAVRGGFIEWDKDAQEADMVPSGKKPPTIRNIARQMEAGHNIKILPRGAKYAPYQQAFPGGNPFEGRRELIRTMAAGAGVGYADMNSDLGSASFSSIRHGFNTAKDACRYIQSIWTRRAGRKIVSNFLMGIEDKLGRSLTDEEYRAARKEGWDFRHYEYIDPDKMTRAMQGMGAMCARSIEQIAREQGNDVYEVINQNLALAKRLELDGTDGEKIQKVLAMFYPNSNASAQAAAGMDAGDNPPAEGMEGDGGADTGADGGGMQDNDMEDMNNAQDN